MNNLFSDIFDGFALNGVHIVQSGATFDDDMTWETAERLGALLAAAYDWSQNDFKLVYGDFLNHSEGRWGEAYAQLVYITGMAVEQLRDYKWVCGQVPLSLRNDNLRYSHYRVVAKSSLSFEQKRDWLNQAIDNGWGARELREAVATWEGETEEQRDAETERLLVDANVIEASAESVGSDKFVWGPGDLEIESHSENGVADDIAELEPEDGVFSIGAREEPRENEEPGFTISYALRKEIIESLLAVERALLSFDYEKARTALRRVKRLFWPSDDCED